jgi:hypothetical protein
MRIDRFLIDFAKSGTRHGGGTGRISGYTHEQLIYEEIVMPEGKGTYGSKVGRPPVKKKTKAKSAKKTK